MSSKIRAVIIDDESLARKITKAYTAEFSDIEIIAECTNGFDGVKKINAEKPDLVFLDIQMPKINGFEMLELLENPPAIIFTTAFDQYALKAFEVNAADYLLKPFSADRFKEAIEKALIQIKTKPKQNLVIKNLIEHNNQNIEYLERVAIKDGAKIFIIPVSKIKWIEAQDDYVMIHSEDGKFLKQKTMKYFENHLKPTDFVRIHRSYIASVSWIKKIELLEKESYQIVLHDSTTLPVSKTGYNKLKEIL